MNKNYEAYKTLLSKCADIGNACALLNWDQETYMPPKSAGFRGQQLSTLSQLQHENFVNDETGNLLEKLKDDSSLSADERKNVSLTLKDFLKAKKYSSEFVGKKSMAVSRAHGAWVKAREENNFAGFENELNEVVQLTREEAAMLGYKEHPYDALLDNYETGANTADLTVLFDDVKKNLVDFVKEISARKQVSNDFLFRKFDKEKQWNFGIDLLKQMNYDFEAGRQDISAHPFTTNFSMHDVRVTTRVNENDFHPMTWGCIHEGGHALYEQGLLEENYGLPAGEATSLGIHESQSRLWENLVGRSLGYWKGNYPKLQKTFSESLSDVSLMDFYNGINQVKPTFIRTEADELTYHFHVMIRFGIEKGLMDGSIAVKDLPEIWNTSYKNYLGIDVPDNARGVLQDIHWCHGSIGYFPTYSLGSFYSVQFFDQAKKEIPNLEMQIEKGELLPLLNWLREKIHRFGRLKSAEELCVDITGEKLNFSHFMNYAKKKFGEIYSI